MAVKPDDKGAARLARPGAAFKQYWVLFIGNITAAQPFEYSANNTRQLCARLEPDMTRVSEGVHTFS